MLRLWSSLRGRERLTKVFWVYYLAGATLLTVVPHLAAEPLYDRGVPLWCFILFAVIQVSYLLWVHVSLWRCAFNVANRVWGYLARVLVCVAILVVAVYSFAPPSQPALEVLLH